ncbi:hypothetical protein [Streptomonospora salina]|uniref:Uncharacterized protein n=1 Tax=Streptomonospora salina TaxID=104205 RepID=A0A841EPF9_9ACTN|nr:hypothetical protein [Streptomonospora salina]MBB6001321.1 hypothetical protein [Streptomonospora salina]
MSTPQIPTRDLIAIAVASAAIVIAVLAGAGDGVVFTLAAVALAAVGGLIYVDKLRNR